MNSVELKAMLALLDIEPTLLAAFYAAIDEKEDWRLRAGRVSPLIDAAEKDERTGFRKGWLSFSFYRKTLVNFGVHLTNNEAHDCLTTLGYIRHPVLTDGRTNNPVKPDGTKARLYVRPGHYSMTFVRPSDVANAYQRDQGFPPSRNP